MPPIRIQGSTNTYNIGAFRLALPASARAGDGAPVSEHALA
jgi:hypothetical protein